MWGAEPSKLAAHERGHGLETSVAAMVVAAKAEIGECAGDRVGCCEEAVQRDEPSEGGAEPVETDDLEPPGLEVDEPRLLERRPARRADRAARARQSP